MANQNSPFDEEQFLRHFAVALDLMGFETELVAIDGYPLSMESKIPGYQDPNLDLVSMFVPMGEEMGGQVRLFQTYISLYDEDIPPEKFPYLTHLCNQLNMNVGTGCFGVQEDIGRICYKMTNPIRDDRDFQTNLQVAMDNLILMSLILDQHYQRILRAILA